VPSGAARSNCSRIKASTGFVPWYTPVGTTKTQNVYSSGGFKPNCAELPNNNGRTYMAAPVSCGGTYAAFIPTASLQHSRKCSVGTPGMEMKDAECCMRSAFMVGLNKLTLPLGSRKAFIPS
jgi:hypothetical protein